MNKRKSHKLEAAHPLVSYAGDAPQLEHPFLKSIAAMPGFRAEAFLETAISRTPETLFGHTNLKELLTRTGNSAFRFETISVKLSSVTCGVTEIHAAIDFVAEGHLGSVHDQKRTISGEATAIFLPDGMVFDVNFAEVDRNGDGAVGASGPVSTQPE